MHDDMTNAEGPAPEDRTIELEEVAPAAARPDVRLPEFLGRYRVVGKLGEGGMGIVYEAEQQNPRRRVAIKVVRGGQFVDEARLKMFQREVETLARLRHPSIGAIHESGCTVDGQHFFVMELVQGQTLAAFLAGRPRELTREELRLRLALFRKLADTVHYAHQRGVIHRDLKPSNIVVNEASRSEDSFSTASGTPAGPRLPEIKVLDFGLARITEGDTHMATQVTEVGMVKGTLPYMSPEQARGNPQDIDLRTDVYALGVILYEMVAGVRPYDVQERSLAEAVRVICEQPPRSLASTMSGTRRLDADVQTIVLKALEKEADRRYASAAALSEDVGRYLGAQPITARPPNAWYQLRKFAARNRALVGGIAATFLALVAGVIVSSALGLREAAQRQRAQRARQDLQTVVDFQSRLLQRVNVERMGTRLFADLRRRTEQALAEEGVPEAQRARELAALDARLRRVNPTDVALKLLDANVLAGAEQAVADELADQPAVFARLSHTLGNTCFDLGVYERAEPLLRRAIDSYRALGAEHEVDAASAQRDLGRMLVFVGRLDEAEPELEAALATHRRLLGEQHEETLNSMSARALLLRERMDWPAAEQAYREVSERRRRAKGEEDENTLADRDGLAWCLMEQERNDEAEAIQTSILATARRVFGDDAVVTLTTLNNLGVNYTRQGRLEEAEPLYLEELAASRRKLGSDHSEVHVSITNLGRLYLRMGRFEDAEKMLREAVELGRRVLAPGNFGMGISLHAWGDSLLGLGRHREAEAALLEAWDILLPLLGEDHRNTRRLAGSLAEVFRAQGAPSRAEIWARRSAETVR